MTIKVILRVYRERYKEDSSVFVSVIEGVNDTRKNTRETAANKRSIEVPVKKEIVHTMYGVLCGYIQKDCDEVQERSTETLGMVFDKRASEEAM